MTAFELNPQYNYYLSRLLAALCRARYCLSVCLYDTIRYCAKTAKVVVETLSLSF